MYSQKGVNNMQYVKKKERKYFVLNDNHLIFAKRKSRLLFNVALRCKLKTFYVARINSYYLCYMDKCYRLIYNAINYSSRGRLRMQ